MGTKRRKTKFSIKSYWAPTPNKMRKIGDSLLGVFSVLSVSSIIMDDKKLAVVTLIVGVLGKILSNFFTEEPVYVQEGERVYENQGD